MRHINMDTGGYMRTMILLAILHLSATAAFGQETGTPSARSPIEGVSDYAWGKAVEHARHKDPCESMELMSIILLLKAGHTLEQSQIDEMKTCANTPKTNGWKDANGLKWQMAIYGLLEIEAQKELKSLREFMASVLARNSQAEAPSASK
ncbi:MAG TPA: hypothetical protein VEC17_01805 [Candidatus Binatia bacterium]|nr:hypothetical protein [Candidatus Binatia bacterium]